LTLKEKLSSAWSWLRAKATAGWGWLSSKTKACRQALHESATKMGMSEPTFEIVKRVPPNLAGAALTVMGIQMAVIGGGVSMAVVVLFLVLFALTTVWAAKAREHTMRQEKAA
jgi:hypothetical protein